MSRLGEDFKAVHILVWHSINFIEGRIRFMPYQDIFEIKELKVEHIGNFSHCLTNLEITLSKFSTTYVLLRSAMFKCEKSFDSTKRW